MSRSIARRMVRLFQQTAVPLPPYHQKLSLREQQVIDYLVQGYSYQEIADALKISYNTVHTHIRHLYKKLQVTSRTDAVTLHLRQTASWQVQPDNGRQFVHPLGLVAALEKPALMSFAESNVPGQ